MRLIRRTAPMGPQESRGYGAALIDIDELGLGGAILFLSSILEVAPDSWYARGYRRAIQGG